MLQDGVPLLRLQGGPTEVGQLLEYEEHQDGAHKYVRDWQALRLGLLTLAPRTQGTVECCLCGGSRTGLTHLLGSCATTSDLRVDFLHRLGPAKAEVWQRTNAWVEALSLDHEPEVLEACVKFGGGVGAMIRKQAA